MPGQNNLELDDILLGDVDDPGDTPPVEPPADDGTEPKPADSTVSKPMERIEELDKQNKDLQELVRQQSEQIKSLSEFRDKITGNTEEEAKKKKDLELRQRYQDDPLLYVTELLDKKLSDIQVNVNKTDRTSMLDRAMREIDKDYIVDWNKNASKIVAQLDIFNKESKDKDPQGMIIKSLSLCGLLKKREKGETPTYVEEGGSGATTPKALKSEADKIKARIIGPKKKSKNVFGL